MKIEIEIPEEFEVDYNGDLFKDFFSRVLVDIDCKGACGNYERKIAEMFVKAFDKSKPAYDIDKVVVEIEKMRNIDPCENIKCSEQPYLDCGECIQNLFTDRVIEIIKQGSISDDVCEWTQSGDMAINPHTFSKYRIKQWDGLYALNICPHCRKKIKIVGD